ncbi:hypothetical protein [Natronorubrum daqingense]|uniref:hypothetical protein n=1 Tax=Natronorubrum daqingense TaxID=588898 RepID=UPI001115AA79|nr:hypothetical protein [Natronorubrum daqingense]
MTVTSRTIHTALGLGAVSYLAAMGLARATPEEVLEPARTRPVGKILVEPDNRTLIGLSIVVAISVSMVAAANQYPMVEWLLIIFQLPFIVIFVGLRMSLETSPGIATERFLYALSVPPTAAWMIILGAGIGRLDTLVRILVSDKFRR